MKVLSKIKNVLGIIAFSSAVITTSIGAYRGMLTKPLIAANVAIVMSFLVDRFILSKEEREE